ncbi:MAG TPA: prolipoprotein diacylglyceryl transferase [Thermodesulfobacteriota bacterium]|nr:prolipoprotein diacylglyceryl transferase [Thermodesulfobacteriota bacterium]
MFASPGPQLVGPFRWYGALIAAGTLLGLWLATREAVRRRLDPDALTTAALVAILVGFLGARLYYVAFNWDLYAQRPWDIPQIWKGGLAIHGGLFAGVLAGWLYMRARRLPVLPYLDVAAPSLVLAQAIGRWGNFFNSEAYGRPTDLPWKLYIPPERRLPGYEGFEFFHPTFLYESLWDFGVFLLLFFVLRRRLETRPGALFFCYLGLYSLGRFFIEGLRLDSLMAGGVRAAQVVSLLLILLAAAGLTWRLKTPPAAPAAAAASRSGADGRRASAGSARGGR